MRTIKNILGSISRATLLLIVGAALALTGSVAFAVTQYPAGALLQPNDVTTSHIRNGTILGEDINSTDGFSIGAAVTFSSTTATTTIAKRLNLSVTASANSSQPTLSFGDGNTGLYESADGTLRIASNGTTPVAFNSSGLFTNQSNGAYILNIQPTATVPAYTFTGDTLTGMGRASAGTVTMTSNGTTTMTILGTNGNVGIGTTSPYTKLAVTGTVTGAGFTATSTGYTFPDNTTQTTAAAPGYNTYSITAGEALTAGDAISIGDGAQSTVSPGATAGDDGTDLSATYWTAQSTTTPATNAEKLISASMWITTAGGKGAGNTYTISMQTDNAGSPSGTEVATGNMSDSGCGAGECEALITFATPVTITPSTKYWFVLKWSGAAPLRRTQYTSGTSNVGKNTADSGSTWNAELNDWMLKVVYSTNTAGRAYKASAATTNFRFNEYVGFAATTVATSSTVNAYNFGWLNIFSGLSIGSTYYLSDTQGAISTSAGSQSLIVGRGITATTLMTRNP